MASTNVDGLVSGLDTTSLVSKLMELERQPQVRLRGKRNVVSARINVYQTLNSRVAALRDAVSNLSTATAWQAMKATSSSTNVSASAASTALPGMLSFTVDRLASSHSVITLASLASTSASVAAPGSAVLLSRAGSLGIASLAVSGPLATGDHAVTVTQSSAGAQVTGDALGAAVTVAAPAQLKIALSADLSGTQTIDLVPGTYSRSALAQMITTASGGSVRASVTSAGELSLTTVREGSAGQLKVMGDTDPGVLTALGLTSAAALPTAASGTDGKITFGASAEFAVTDTAATASAVLDLGGGTTVTARFSGGVRTGTVTARQVSLGDGSLAAVVSAINGANAGMTASAVQVAPGAYKLQIASKSTGAAGALSLAPDHFGATETLSEGRDAQITVGSGLTALQVTSAGNTFTGVLPGVTLSAVKADPATMVTVSVSTDSGALADKVAKLVEGFNGVISYIKLQGAYNAETKQGGPLLGDATARQLESELYRQLSQPGGDLKSLGLSVTKEGYLQFDRAAFTAAYEADPGKVIAAFGDNAAGTADDGLAKRLETAAKAATDSVGGLLTTAIAGRKTELGRLEKSISDWDVRLVRKEVVLRRQFTGLETALSNLRNQSTWLAGQLSGLSNNSRS